MKLTHCPLAPAGSKSSKGGESAIWSVDPNTKELTREYSYFMKYFVNLTPYVISPLGQP